ncbi:CdiA family toxin C-terminal domain-containing protein [Pseudomonas mosselii]|uniref:CdiA family toxin C-terminal domain-containing protein n=1 Tax=Pseudomonas mosselii TaxID=78327 RepID=UPI002867E3AB|nr:CdiA family toxin C-terminal domain-containing protein [Pseudomonas mosselii]
MVRTGTLGHREYRGQGPEHGYYLNVGGSWKPVKNAKDEKSATVSGWEYEKDREQIVRAAVGAGDINVRGDADTGQDSTVGLNWDLDKAYQITRDHESRTDLYISDTAVNDALHPVATVNRWSNELRNYDKTALKNLEQAGNVVNVLVNRFERLQGRQLDAGAVAIGGVKLAEDTYEALLMANFKPDEAKALMRTPSFQQEVLARLNQIEHVFDKHEESTNELARLWGAMELDPTPITERRGPVQMALTYSSQINEYLDADPERGQKLALALAMIQGPKAVIQLAVSTAIGQTELGQDLNEQYDRAMTRVGTMLAEHMEGGGVVLNGESDSDKFLVGGGKLISSMILGVASGRKGSGGHEAKKPTTTPVELPGGGKGVINGAKNVASFPEGISFNPNLKKHLSGFDGLSQKSGISGTHNLEAFTKAASSNGIKILSESPTSVNGITNFVYQIPAYDRAGNVVGYKAKEFTKTVYDPKIFSDQKILDLGQQAAASGYKDALSKGVTQFDATAGGVSFRVYLDRATGAVTNFHPQ